MEGYFEEVMVLIHSALMGMMYYSYRDTRSLVRTMQQAPEYTVGKELEHAVSTANNRTIEYALIQGIVKATDESVKTLSGRSAVIRSEISVERLRSKLWTRRWWSNRTTGSTSTYMPFRLVNPYESSPRTETSVHVTDAVSAELHDVLTTTGSKIVEAPATSYSILSIFANSPREETEVMERALLTDTVLTAAGKIVRKPDGSIHLENPMQSDMPFILTTKSVDSLRNLARGELTAYIVGSMICGTITLFFAARIFFRFWGQLKRRRLCREIMKRRDPKGIAGLSEAQICIACLSNPREILFAPCGHVCTCVECWLKLKDNKCPFCRETIKHTVPAFIP